LLEKFCKCEEAAHYKGFGMPPDVQNQSFSPGNKIIFARLINYSRDKSMPLKSKKSFSRLRAPFSPSLRRIAVIVNQAVTVRWQ
jgi:hypothetical protein